MWNDVKDKSIVLPSYTSKMIVTDGENVSIITVSAFLKSVDSPWCQWKYWMSIPKLPE